MWSSCGERGNVVMSTMKVWDEMAVGNWHAVLNGKWQADAYEAFTVLLCLVLFIVIVHACLRGS